MIFRLGDWRPVLEGSGHFVAGNATVIGRVRLRSESSVWFGSVLRGDKDWIEVGERSNVQDGCVLHTDIGYPMTIGPGVTVGHKAMLHGCTEFLSYEYWIGPPPGNPLVFWAFNGPYWLIPFMLGVRMWKPEPFGKATA